MALINCPECKKEISDTSEKCIHCGYKLVKTIICPECGQEIDTDSKICSNCGIKLHTKNDKKKSIIVGVIVAAALLIIAIFSLPNLMLSDDEKAIKLSIQELNIQNEEILTCQLLDSEEDYYIYFKTEDDEYMTHVVDGVIESSCNRSKALIEGVTGNKASAEFVWSDYTGRKTWETINHDILDKLQ